jgi:hypothetical protein
MNYYIHVCSLIRRQADKHRQLVGRKRERCIRRNERKTGNKEKNHRKE